MPPSLSCNDATVISRVLERKSGANSKPPRALAAAYVRRSKGSSLPSAAHVLARSAAAACLASSKLEGRNPHRTLAINSAIPGALIARRTLAPVNSVPPARLAPLSNSIPTPTNSTSANPLFVPRQRESGAPARRGRRPGIHRPREIAWAGPAAWLLRLVPMHACFHGGSGGGGGVSRITKSVGIIAKSMKALSLLKVKAPGDGEGRAPEPRRRRGRRRRRHRRRSPEAGEELREDKEDAAASSSASSSAKIAPAQPHDADDGDRPPPEGRGAKHERCDKCCSPLDDGADREEEEVEDEEESDREWAAEPEPGVLMTLVSRGDGTNRLRRIRFSEEYFGDAWEAQSWWADNCDRIVELYSVVVQPEDPSRGGDEDDEDDGPAPPATPCQSEDDEHQRQDGIGELEYSASCSASASASGGSTSNFSGPSSGSGSANKVDSPILGLVTEADSITRTARAQRSHTSKGQGH
ncbi:hypothetical protein U9M48_032918 [Paspalum notatum var. saurae]|uniref:BRX domain-containing protein n=1 Tax=Paspalum notatum var. saurae TaxID=547442 RepID=A0AAQ3U8X8_PASNO